MDCRKNCENNRLRIFQKLRKVILFALIFSAVIFSAGCIVEPATDVEKTPVYNTTPVAIPEDVHEGIHDFYKDICYIGLSVSADLHSLSEQISKANTHLGKENVLFEYYSNNPWVNSVVYYDAVNDVFITAPLFLNKEILDAVPVPDEKEFKESSDGIVKKKCIFIPEQGYLNIYYKAVYDINKNYLGYVVILFELYSELNHHPMIIGDDNLYGNYITYVVDSDGKIIFSSKQDAMGESITNILPYYDGTALLIQSNDKTGAYQYSSSAFYNYDSKSTEKIAAWHTFDMWGEEMTIYLVKELDMEPLQFENVYSDDMLQMIKDVENFYYFEDTNGILKSIERLDSGHYKSNMMILDMDGNIVSSSKKDSIGLNILNNRDIYGYSYAATAIATAKQGGGYIYLCYPIDGRMDSPAYKYEFGYVLPIGEENLMLGIVSASPDIYEKDQYIREDLIKLSREVLKKAHDNSIYRVITLINSEPEDTSDFFISGLNTEIGDIAVFDYTGNIYASTYDPTTVGSVLTFNKDVYGGSVIRKNIMLAKNGGGFLMDLIKNPDKEGYVDLWLIYTEPFNDYYYINTAAIIGTFKDDVSDFI